jgi:lycopene cyclase domain-containing protein
MTYTFLAIAAVIATFLLERWVIRSGVFAHYAFAPAYLIVVFFQLVTNGYLTGMGIVLYSEPGILGIRIANAPLEDLLFGFALVVLSMAVWLRLGQLERNKKLMTRDV